MTMDICGRRPKLHMSCTPRKAAFIHVLSTPYSPCIYLFRILALSQRIYKEENDGTILTCRREIQCTVPELVHSPCMLSTSLVLNWFADEQFPSQAPGPVRFLVSKHCQLSKRVLLLVPGFGDLYIRSGHLGWTRSG